MSEPTDLSTPALRRKALRMIDVDDPRPHHERLREIFDLERTYRESPERSLNDEFEHIYVAAFLLFKIGDPADVPRLYSAKFRTSDFDLGLGFDTQSIFGAGREETLKWLQDHGYPEEHARLSEWLSSWDDPTIEKWAESKSAYFYSPDGVLLLEPL